MSIQVFYCTCPKDELRKAIAAPCLLMWQSMCEPIIITKPEGMSGKEFQQWRREEAERLSTTPYYVIADDDCMPLGKRFLERCEELMQKYPEYAILGTEDYCAPFGPTEIYDTSTGGGINVIRKGVIEVPKFNGQTWDGCAQGVHVRSKGYKVGRMRDVRRNHYGDGLSTVWPDDYRSGVTQIA